jgi:hypothetical protein
LRAVHLLPTFGQQTLDSITTEQVQQLKAKLKDRAPRTVNNILSVLNTALKKAVEWGVIEQVPCVVRFLPMPTKPMAFHSYEDYAKLVDAARRGGARPVAVVLLGGDAGLRRGEITDGRMWISRSSSCVCSGRSGSAMLDRLKADAFGMSR